MSSSSSGPIIPFVPIPWPPYERQVQFATQAAEGDLTTLHNSCILLFSTHPPMRISGSTLTTVTQFDTVRQPAAQHRAAGTFSATAPADVANATVLEQAVFARDKGGNLAGTTSMQRLDNAIGKRVRGACLL